MSRDFRAFGFIPGLCAGFCGLSVRFLLLAVLIVNLAIASVLVQQFTSINGISIPNASPPGAIIFTMVVSSVTIFYMLISFCCIAAPIFVVVGDTISFVGWFTAAIIIGSALSQTLSFSCQDLAISLTGGIGGLGGIGLGRGIGIGSGLGIGQSQIAQQIFDSCNISKTLFSFHVIAAALFVVTALNAAVSASCMGFGGGRRRARDRGPGVQQQNNYYGRSAGYGPGEYRGGMKSTPGPEIVV